MVKKMWPRCDINHSHPSSTEVNNGWSYAFIPPIRLQGADRATVSTHLN